MTEYMKDIKEAIYTLYSKNSKVENIVICFSHLFFKIILEPEIYAKYINLSSISTYNMRKVVILEGVEVRGDYPYNDRILIYDKEKACINPELIIEIPINEKLL